VPRPPSAKRERQANDYYRGASSEPKPSVNINVPRRSPGSSHLTDRVEELEAEKTQLKGEVVRKEANAQMIVQNMSRKMQEQERTKAKDSAEMAGKVQLQKVRMDQIKASAEDLKACSADDLEATLASLLTCIDAANQELLNCLQGPPAHTFETCRFAFIDTRVFLDMLKADVLRAPLPRHQHLLERHPDLFHYEDDFSLASACKGTYAEAYCTIMLAPLAGRAPSRRKRSTAGRHPAASTRQPANQVVLDGLDVLPTARVRRPSGHVGCRLGS